MSKLNYPEYGIYRYCQSDIETCQSNLLSAKSNCIFDIPYDFKYRGYLQGLEDTFDSFLKEINSICSCIQLVDSNYELLEDELTSSSNKIVANKIKERKRMII